MNTIDWNDLALKATFLNEDQFTKEIASCTNFNFKDLKKIITESKITHQNLIKTLKLIYDVTASNNEKAKAILNIENGLIFVLKLFQKVL